MAICLMVDNADESEKHFEAVMEHLKESGPVPPAGASVLVSGSAEGGWRVISVWDSQESLQRFFAERLVPAYEKAGLSFDKMKRSTFEVHTHLTP
jgi:hypothetical protein